MLGLKLELDRRKDERNKKLEIFNSVMKNNFEEIKSVLPNAELYNDSDGSTPIRFSYRLPSGNITSPTLVEFKKPVPPLDNTSYKEYFEEELKREVLSKCGWF